MKVRCVIGNISDDMKTHDMYEINRYEIISIDIALEIHLKDKIIAVFHTSFILK